MRADLSLDRISRATAGLLAAGQGAVLSRNTAAWIHGCTAAESLDVHVTVPYSNWVRSKDGLIVHHDRFATEDVVYRHELPVLSLAATITELLCVPPRWLALACLDQALAGLPEHEIGEFRAEVDQRLTVRDSNRGIRIAQALLFTGTNKAESPWESRLRLTVIDAGFPWPEPQYEIRTLSGRLLYVLDLAWPDLRIGLEYDGYEAHEERAEYDAERDRRMAERGWLMIRVRKGDLTDPGPLIERLRRAFERRGHPISA
ncbi:uncharacterized protein DUF559 [Amycolatopsis cihanbeyliensis]|uniref:Uncharacterized protein DUF559 n=2 Tax=Amycolatopsis cihanbeyliensis TaxID=1128664 RepID=A0A542DNP6_AMYCI|nr:uncharacterized protein DUF559 [Amycolatopsis cihanbeyliensis]